MIFERFLGTYEKTECQKQEQEYVNKDMSNKAVKCLESRPYGNE